MPIAPNLMRQEASHHGFKRLPFTVGLSVRRSLRPNPSLRLSFNPFPRFFKQFDDRDALAGGFARVPRSSMPL